VSIGHIRREILSREFIETERDCRRLVGGRRGEQGTQFKKAVVFYKNHAKLGFFAAVHKGFGDVREKDFVGMVQVRDGAGYF